MKKYIKSIFTSRKQLMLLPLMLVSGGIMQAQTAVPDTVYVSFNTNTPLPMTYGDNLSTAAAGIDGASFNYFYADIVLKYGRMETRRVSMEPVSTISM